MFVLIHWSECRDMKFIGIFKEYNTVLEQIHHYKTKEGFKENPEGFEIIDIPVFGNIDVAKMEKVYLIEILSDNEETQFEEDVEYYGVVANAQTAKEIIDDGNIPKDSSKKIEIQEVYVDSPLWVEGFVTMEI